MSHDNHDRTYIAIWAVLLVALLFSLWLGAVSPSPAAVAVIFGVALLKAGLVVGRFMHLSLEPRWIKLVMLGAVSAVGIFFVGVYDDVATHWSVMPRAVAAAHEAGGAPEAAPTLEPGDAGRGAKVYTTFCVGCHAADGRANGGTTGADFVGDATRLAKSDAEILASIADGKTGTIGVMPPWKAALSEQQRVDVLAYLRATFGTAR